MNPTCDVDHVDLAQATPSGNRVRHAMEGLDRYFGFESTAIGRGWSEIKGSPEGSKALSTVRMAFWADLTNLKRSLLLPSVEIFAGTS